MSDWREGLGPEAWIDDDPFIDQLVQADDLIIDYTYNYEWLGKSASEGATMAAWVEQTRLTYELTTLDRWWSLP